MTTELSNQGDPSTTNLFRRAIRWSRHRGRSTPVPLL